MSCVNSFWLSCMLIIFMLYLCVIASADKITFTDIIKAWTELGVEKQRWGIPDDD